MKKTMMMMLSLISLAAGLSACGSSAGNAPNCTPGNGQGCVVLKSGH